MTLRPLLVANYDRVFGGGEVGLLMLAEGLRRRGHRPLIAVPGHGPLAANLERVRIDPRRPAIDHDLARLAADADLVHVYSTAAMAAVDRSDIDKPIVHHALVPNRHPSDARLAARAHVVVCNSHATAARFAGSRNVEVVYNGVAEPSRPATSLGLDPRRRTIALIGGTVLRKGQLDALPALLDVVATADDVDAIFIGRSGGPEALRLRRYALASQGRLRLLGHVPRVADHMSQFVLVLVPSRSEGFGRVAVEAMRAGTPVLATRVEGLQEALSDLSDPWLPDDSTNWAARIMSELDNPSHTPDELRAAGRRFEPPRFLSAIEDIYHRLVRGHGTSA